MARLERELKNLTTLYNWNPGDVLTETRFYSAVEIGHLERKTYNQAWNTNDPIERKKWRDAIGKEIKDMTRRKFWTHTEKRTWNKTGE